jgi:two-component system, chemotaxis family, sensor kinase CheA
MADGHDQFIAGFMDDYFAECDEHLVTVRDLLLTLERSLGSAAPQGALDELFRSFHSIKGISGMVELRPAEMLAHEMESYLRALRQRDTSLSQAGVDALIAGVDALERVIAARREERQGPDVAPVLKGIAAVVPGTDPDAGAAPPEAAAIPSGADWIVTFTPSADLSQRGITVDVVRTRLREHGTIVSASPRILEGGIAFEFGLAGRLDDDTRAAWAADGLVAAPPISGAAPSPDVTPDAEPDESADNAVPVVSHYVRVDLARLDDLMRMIGDLVISRARLEDALARIEPRVPAVDWRAVQESSAAIERHLRDLREGVVRVRLVPVGEIFRRMPFVVRDLARESGARVNLVLKGQDTEIDKFLIERMMDPVLHLVRNAVTHAFESPEERRAAGKPEVGTLTMSATTVGESVVLDIADDGRGVDVERVARRARELQLPVPDVLDDDAVLDLLSAAGFSTRDETDRGSGRGVGMTVVRSTVQQLDGRMWLHTEPGRGTRFTIELPLTLSITEAMIATVGDRTFAIPQTAVREVIEIDPAALRRIEHHELAPYRGGTLPVVRLSRIFDIGERPRRSLHAFVVGAGSEAVAVAVDRIAGQREIVVRAMADSMVRVSGVSGATDLGDGRVVLILNLAALARAGQEPGGGTGRLRSVS